MPVQEPRKPLVQFVEAVIAKHTMRKGKPVYLDLRPIPLSWLTDDPPSHTDETALENALFEWLWACDTVRDRQDRADADWVWYTTLKSWMSSIVGSMAVSEFGRSAGNSTAYDRLYDYWHHEAGFAKKAEPSGG